MKKIAFAFVLLLFAALVASAQMPVRFPSGISLQAATAGTPPTTATTTTATPASAPALPVSAVSVAALETLKLPNYVALCGAYNQLGGGNACVAAILPISDKIGMYEATVVDIFPTWNFISNKRVLLLQTSIREEVHKVLYQTDKTMLMVGLGAGAVFSPDVSAGVALVTTSGGTSITGAATFTWVHHLNKSWSFMVPLRMVYLPQGWNPIAQMALVWKPGAQK